MHVIAQLQRQTGLLMLMVASALLCNALVQTDQEKTKAGPETKSAEKKPEANATGGIEILSDTRGVDFGRYMKQLRFTVQGHWGLLIPDEARPPISKPGSVVIEFAILKDGKLDAMKLVQSSDDYKLPHGGQSSIPCHCRNFPRSLKATRCACVAALFTTLHQSNHLF